MHQYNIRNSSHPRAVWHYSDLPVSPQTFSGPSASVRLMFAGWLVGHYNTMRPSGVYYFLNIFHLHLLWTPIKQYNYITAVIRMEMNCYLAGSITGSMVEIVQYVCIHYPAQLLINIWGNPNVSIVTDQYSPWHEGCWKHLSARLKYKGVDICVIHDHASFIIGFQDQHFLLKISGTIPTNINMEIYSWYSHHQPMTHIT